MCLYNFFSKKNSPKYCVTIDIDTFEVTEILYFLPITTILEDFYSFQSCILFLTPHPSKKKMKQTKRLYSWSRYIIHDNRAREKGRGEGLEKSQSGLERVLTIQCASTIPPAKIIMASDRSWLKGMGPGSPQLIGFGQPKFGSPAPNIYL